jgi:hypothetical protein
VTAAEQLAAHCAALTAALSRWDPADPEEDLAVTMIRTAARIRGDLAVIETEARLAFGWTSA